MPPDESPTVRRWELASRLRVLREESSLSLEDVAARMLCSPSKLSRIETATRAPSLRDVRDLARIYDAPLPLQDELMELAREAKQPGWWTSYDEVANRSATYIGLEQAASAIRCYETIMVPGPLQTPDYTRALMRRILPLLSGAGVEQYVETRQARQRDVFRSSAAPSYWVVLDEAVVSRQVGGREVMREQIDYLLSCVTDRLVTLQIIPFEAGAHAGMFGTFTIMEFAGNELADVVYVEDRSGQLFLNRAADLRAFRETLDFLVASAASPDDSMLLLEARLKR